jgi:hypothetical protein
VPKAKAAPKKKRRAPVDNRPASPPSRGRSPASPVSDCTSRSRKRKRGPKRVRIVSPSEHSENNFGDVEAKEEQLSDESRENADYPLEEEE